MELMLVSSAMLILTLLFLLLFLYIFKTLIREHKNQIQLIFSNQPEVDNLPQLELIRLLGKTVAMLSAKDPMSFQAIQAMDSTSNSVAEPKDNSGQGEYLQWVDDNPELSEEEKVIFREVNYDG